MNIEIDRGVTQGKLHNYGTAAIVEGVDSAVFKGVWIILVGLLVSSDISNTEFLCNAEPRTV